MKNRRLALLLAALLAVCTFAVLAPAAFAGAAAREPAWGSEGHGLVEFDKAEHLPGETVTVTVTPDSGYCLAIISVNDGKVAMTKTGKNTYTFTMPDDETAVHATFECTTDGISTVAEGGTIYLRNDNGTIYVNVLPDVGKKLDTLTVHQVTGDDLLKFFGKTKDEPKA